MSERNYIVVELAGYIGENDRGSFKTIGAAQAFIKRSYYANERDPHHPNSLRVEIATEIAGERSYEI